MYGKYQVEIVYQFLKYLYENSSIHLQRKYLEYYKATWSCKTGLIAGNSHSTTTVEGQSAANL